MCYNKKKRNYREKLRVTELTRVIFLVLTVNNVIDVPVGPTAAVRKVTYVAEKALQRKWVRAGYHPRLCV